MVKTDRDRMIAALDASDYSLFPTYDDSGINTGVVSRSVVRKCIEAGYVFDLEYVPQSIIDKVNPIDWSQSNFSGWKESPYKVVKPVDYYSFPRRRPWA